MKKLIYSFATVLAALTSCISFDDPTTENYGAGPSVDVAISAGLVTDSVFTVTITPGEGALYYAFAVGDGDSPEELDSATLYKGGYGNAVVKVADQPTTSFTIDDADPNTTYWVYAVAGNAKGIVGNMVIKSITTTDSEAPQPMTIQRDEDNAALQLGFSEAILRGEGAVKAQYYQEWDVMNPVDVPEDNISVEVSGNTATFVATDIPAGAYLCFSYEAGAFKDVKGIACAALNSGLNIDAGRFTGAYVHVTNIPFTIDITWVTAPENGALIADADGFEGKITFPFDVYRIEDSEYNGNVVVSFVNSQKKTSFNLDNTQWSVAGKELTFSLPAEPEVGDQIFVAIAEGAVFDVCGNPNLAFQSISDWRFFPVTKDYFLGNFGLEYISYYDDNALVVNLGDVTIEETSEDGAVVIKNFYQEGSELVGAYDLNAGKLYIEDSQVLGLVEEDGKVYGLLFVNADDEGPVSFTLNPSGPMLADGMWGVYAFDENFEEALGWWDISALTVLSPLDSGARKTAVRKAVKATTKFVKKDFSRNLNKRVRK